MQKKLYSIVKTKIKLTCKYQHFWPRRVRELSIMSSAIKNEACNLKKFYNIYQASITQKIFYFFFKFINQLMTAF